MHQHFACELETLKKEKKHRVELHGIPILLTYVDGHVFAINDKCPHLGASLEKGTLENGMITCAKHHAQIDVKTGEINEKAKILFLKMPTKKAKTYSVKIEDGKIFIEV